MKTLLWLSLSDRSGANCALFSFSFVGPELLVDKNPTAIWAITRKFAAYLIGAIDLALKGRQVLPISQEAKTFTYGQAVILRNPLPAVGFFHTKAHMVLVI